MYNTLNVAETIKEAAKKKGYSIATLLKDCGLGKDTINTMARRGSWVQADSLAKIADRLDCSVDYLLGRTTNPRSHKDKDSNTVSVGNVSGNSNSIIGNGSVSNVTLAADDLDNHQKELIELYGKLTAIQQAKLLVLVSDVVDGKSNL